MIICAAVKFYMNNENLGDENGEIIITGFRHANCYELIRDLGFKPSDYKELEQGFINHQNKFLNRKEAFVEACLCGQLCATVRYNKNKKQEVELFSEDLY